MSLQHSPFWHQLFLVFIGFGFSVFASQPSAASDGIYQLPPSDVLERWGLSYIPPFSTPRKVGGQAPESKNYLKLGPKKGGSTQCVTLVKVNAPNKVCSVFKCEGLFPWGEKLPVLVGQHALLSQPCGGSKTSQSTVLYNNTVPYGKTQADRLDSHVIVLSSEELAQAIQKDPHAPGWWQQIIVSGEYRIQMSTTNAEGHLRWRPKRGFEYWESE